MLAHNQRVIFLDIDGVLNTNGADGESRPFVSFDDAAVGKLREIVDRSGASIVLSTSWRKHLQYLNYVFGKYGLLGAVSPRSGPERPLSSDMRTPVFADTGRRDLEILQWLKLYEGKLGVESWVVLDDMDLLAFPETKPRLEGHFVRTRHDVGLTSDDVERALKLLDAKAGAYSTASSTGPASLGPDIANSLRSAMDPLNEALVGGMSDVLAALKRERPQAIPPASQAQSTAPQPARKVCPDGHPLTSFRPPCTGFCCDSCGDDLEEGKAALRCEACNGTTFCATCMS